jgi:hypothetical protein
MLVERQVVAARYGWLDDVAGGAGSRRLRRHVIEQSCLRRVAGASGAVVTTEAQDSRRR